MALKIIAICTSCHNKAGLPFHLLSLVLVFPVEATWTNCFMKVEVFLASIVYIHFFPASSDLSFGVEKVFFFLRINPTPPFLWCFGLSFP